MSRLAGAPGMLGTSVLLAVAIAGTGDLGLFDCFKSGERCDDCRGDLTKMHRLIDELDTHPSWCRRDNAAFALRKYDWECHPEVVDALVTALATDESSHVRAEAAQTLGKLAPCIPDVHEALEAAKTCDPSRSVRKDASRALEKLGDECDGECSVCGTTDDPPVIVDPEPPIETRFAPLPGGPAEAVAPAFPAPVDVEELPPPAIDTPLPPLAPLPSEIPPLPTTSTPFGSASHPDTEDTNRSTKETYVKTAHIDKSKKEDANPRPRPSARETSDRDKPAKKSTDSRPRLLSGLSSIFRKR